MADPNGAVPSPNGEGPPGSPGVARQVSVGPRVTCRSYLAPGCSADGVLVGMVVVGGEGVGVVAAGGGGAGVDGGVTESGHGVEKGVFDFVGDGVGGVEAEFGGHGDLDFGS